MKKWVVITLIVVAFLGTILGAWIFVKKSEANTTAEDQTVQLPSKEKVFINGTIVPQDSETVTVPTGYDTMGTIAVTNGQNVSVGQELFRCSASSITEQIETLNNTLNASDQEIANQNTQIANTEERISALEQTQNDSTAIAQIQALQEQLEGYKTQESATEGTRSDTENSIATLRNQETKIVTAPIAGQLTIADGDPLKVQNYMVIDSNTYIFRGTVDETSFSKIFIDQAVDLLIVPTNTTQAGKIISISNKPITTTDVSGTGTSTSSSTSSVSQYQVEVALESNEGMVNGYHAQGTIVLDDYSAIVAKSVLLTDQDKNYVLVKKEDGSAEKVEIDYTKTEDPDKITLTKGLTGGETIYLYPENIQVEDDAGDSK